MKAIIALMSASHSMPSATSGFLLRPKSPARLMSHIAVQPQKPITSQFMFVSIERALELVCAIEQQQGLLPIGGVDADQYPQCCRDGPNQMFHVDHSR